MWVSVQVYECRCVCAYLQCVGCGICIIYSSNFLPFSLSLSLPSSHHLLISCLLQLKSLHPFAFGDSASDHSKMQGFVRQLQEVETHSTEYVTYIPHHTHTHALGEIHSDMPPSQSHNIDPCYAIATCILYVYLTTYILPLLLHNFSIIIVQATLCHGVSYTHSLTTPHSARLYQLLTS